MDGDVFKPIQIFPPVTYVCAAEISVLSCTVAVWIILLRFYFEMVSVDANHRVVCVVGTMHLRNWKKIVENYITALTA